VYENSILIDYVTESPNVSGDDLCFFLALFVSPFTSKSRLEAGSFARRESSIGVCQKLPARRRAWEQYP